MLILGNTSERNGLVVALREGMEAILQQSSSLMVSGTCIAKKLDMAGNAQTLQLKNDPSAFPLVSPPAHPCCQKIGSSQAITLPTSTAVSNTATMASLLMLLSIRWLLINMLGPRCLNIMNIPWIMLILLHFALA